MHARTNALTHSEALEWRGCCCSQQRTPVDEVLGKDFQEPMLAVIDSFQAPAPPGALDPEDPEMAAYAAAPEGALR